VRDLCSLKHNPLSHLLAGRALAAATVFTAAISVCGLRRKFGGAESADIAASKSKPQMVLGGDSRYLQRRYFLVECIQKCLAVNIMGTRYNSKFDCKQIPQTGFGLIYALSDPRNPRLPKYVGKTLRDLRRRLSAHLCLSSQKNETLKLWISELKLEGLIPTAYVLEQASKEKLGEREEAWISFFKPLGILTNKSNGDGSKGLKGYVSPLNRRITAERNRRSLSAETIEKIRRANIGKKPSPESVRKMLESSGYKIASKKLAESNQKKSLAIVCNETGQSFDSLNQAAKELKCGVQNLRASILSNRQFHGQTWKFKEGVLL
jgi:GIY-YIG catalytic domain